MTAGSSLPRGGIGASLARKEDPRLLRGLGRFGADFARPGQLWARVVRSPVAHGRLRGVDTTQAIQADGVVTVVTAASLPPGLAIPVRLQVAGADLRAYLQPVLAADTVRYVGEPVAVVVARDPYAAEDAAELVGTDIEEAPAVLDAAAAAAPGAPALFPGGNVAADFSLGYGDVAGAFARADRIVEIEVEIGRHGAVPLEPRALLADPDLATGRLSIFGMTKVPVFNRDLLASMLGLDEALIHVHAVDAGGGFGARGEFYPEDFLVPWLARTLRRPVMWVEDRAEHLVAVNHSRQQAHRIAAAFDAGGAILGLRDDVVHDNGAYCRTHGIIVPELTVAMLPGPYRVPAYRGRIRVVATSKTPCGTYRAPGRFEGSTAREQLLDVAAHKLKISRNEIRSRNLLRPGELPCQRAMSTLGTEVILDAGDYPALLAAATVVAGSAVHAAAGAVRDRAAEVAARMLEAAPGDLVITRGRISVRGDPGAAVTLAEVARATEPASPWLRPGEPAGLSARRRFEVTHMTYPYGVHLAVVDVDPGTGGVQVLRYLVAYEVGRAVNPALVAGQLRGGAAQGIGGALMEEFCYDENGQPQSATFMDYRVPTAAEVPPIDVLITQDSLAPGNPLGVRGAGEGGVSAAGAVLASAVRDALGLAGSVERLPLTPARVQELATNGGGR